MRLYRILVDHLPPPRPVLHAGEKGLRQTFLIVLLSLLVVVGTREAGAQSKDSIDPCRIGHQAAATGFWTWAAHARVQVYIRSADFEPEQVTYLLTALKNWNDASEQTASGVRFEYQGNTEQRRACENCLTILRDRVFDKVSRHPMELSAYSAADNQIITTATIFVDPVLTNPRALLNALVHELGHNLGLLDCYTCKRKSTVMTQFEALNESNDMEKPTACDMAQVKRRYKELKEIVRESAASRKPIVVDEGEEPVDDDTPVVVPVSSRRLTGGAATLKPASRPE